MFSNVIAALTAVWRSFFPSADESDVTAEVGDVWQHRSGDLYEIDGLHNTSTRRRRFPTMVSYTSLRTGYSYARPLRSFLKSMVLFQAAGSRKKPDCQPTWPVSHGDPRDPILQYGDELFIWYDEAGLIGGAEYTLKGAERASIRYAGWVNGLGKPSFQERIFEWVQACFGDLIDPAKAVDERLHRFVEEAFELAQALDMDKSDVQTLLDYVYGRDKGQVAEEMGDVYATLGALCEQLSLNSEVLQERALKKAWARFDQIRAKRLKKPDLGPLPVQTLVHTESINGLRVHNGELTVPLKTYEKPASLGSGKAVVLPAGQGLTPRPSAE